MKHEAYSIIYDTETEKFSLKCGFSAIHDAGNRPVKPRLQSLVRLLEYLLKSTELDLRQDELNSTVKNDF